MKVLISFDLSPDCIDMIRQVSSSLEIVKSKNKKEALRQAKNADVLFAGYFSQELFASATKLKWIQSWGAGVDGILIDEVIRSNVVVTNAGGVHPIPISEHVFGLMLCFSRKLNIFIKNQSEKHWNSLGSSRADQVEELNGKTLGIVGLGRIGTEIARKAKCFGMKVIATKRDPQNIKPDYVDILLGPTHLNNLLKLSDFVVLSLPLTKETSGMIGESQLKNMKKTACLINVSRGGIIQEKRLVTVLKKGWIGGAGLDTFENEPLPATSELWGLRNVIITPHVAGHTPFYMERLTEIFTENLTRFIKNQPLINVVDKKLGY